jgi:hypothetical protein
LVRSEREALKLLNQYKNEMNMVKKNPSSFRCAFYIMKKIEKKVRKKDE